MVRNYKRKKENTYSREKLLEAVELVKQKKLNSYAAADLFNIPRSTIISHIYGTRGQIQKNPGKATVFSNTLEQELSSYLHVMEKNGFPLTAKEVKALVSDYIKRNGIITPFLDDVPGDDWLRGFRKRNNLSLKKPQPVEIARKRACNPFTVYEYFTLLEGVMNDLGIAKKPDRIYNLDETSFCSDPSKSRVIGQKGFRCTRTTSSPGRDNTTVLLATNAAGHKVPPLIIFQGKYLWNEWCHKDQSIKTAYTVSQKGWMETSIFEKYFRSVFLPAIGNERPVLLIYDGHSTHVDLNVIKLAQSENITIVKLPAHSSDVLQPLDCSGMKPMKDRWDEALVNWQRLHVGAKLPKKEFSRILTEIWTNLNPVILQNGFKKTGIYPLNREAIPKEIFDPLIWNKWEQHVKKLENNNIVEDIDIEYLENSLASPEELYIVQTLENESIQETHNNNTHQFYRNQVVEIPTLFSLALNFFNLHVNNQKNLRPYKNCKRSEVTENREEIVEEYYNSSVNNNEEVKQIQEEITGLIPNAQEVWQKIHLHDIHEYNIKGQVANEKKLYQMKQIKKGPINEPILDEKQKSRLSYTVEKQDAFRQVRQVPSSDTKITSSKITILENVLIKPATSNNNNEKLKVTKEPKELITYERKQPTYILENTETTKAEINQKLKHSQNAEIPVTYKPIEENKENHDTVNVSFQDLLLKTIARNDPPKTKKKRITKGAEILTYKEVIDRMERESEEKKKKIQQKQVRQMKKRKIKTKPKKSRKAKKKMRYETDSNTSCSFQSDDSSDNEDPETFFKSLLEDNSDNDFLFLDEHESMVNEATLIAETHKDSSTVKKKLETKREVGKVAKEQKKEKIQDGRKACTSASMKKGPSWEGVPSTSKEEFVPTLKEGDFILAKFSSTKGKKTYKYVCLIEDIAEDKAVVKGLKSHKRKNTFKFIKNDVSIIDLTDILTLLPQPNCIGELYKFSNNIDVIEQ